MIMETISRKTMLYKTGVEYGDYTMNHILGCSHGCKFPCYAFLLKRRFGIISSYEEWCKPRLVVNTLELLELNTNIINTFTHYLSILFMGLVIATLIFYTHNYKKM